MCLHLLGQTDGAAPIVEFKQTEQCPCQCMKKTIIKHHFKKANGRLVAAKMVKAIVFVRKPVCQKVELIMGLKIKIRLPTGLLTTRSYSLLILLLTVYSFFV